MDSYCMSCILWMLSMRIEAKPWRTLQIKGKTYHQMIYVLCVGGGWAGGGGGRGGGWWWWVEGNYHSTLITQPLLIGCGGKRGVPYPDGVYTPAWSVHSKATLLPLPLECTLQPHSEYHRCTLGCHSMDLVKSLTNRNTLQRHFKCTPDGVCTPLPLL